MNLGSLFIKNVCIDYTIPALPLFRKALKKYNVTYYKCRSYSLRKI